jgi:hypothetical protein
MCDETDRPLGGVSGAGQRPRTWARALGLVVLAALSIAAVAAASASVAAIPSPGHADRGSGLAAPLQNVVRPEASAHAAEGSSTTTTQPLGRSVSYQAAAVAGGRAIPPLAVALHTSPSSTLTTTTIHTPTSGVGSGAFVGRKGTLLTYEGAPFRLIGINAPQLATYYPVNGGCGAQIDPAAFFASLPPHTAVGVGFQQDETVNATTGARDWRGLDRVVQAAEQSPTRPLLVVSLANQGGICDANVWKGSAWYTSGYRTPQNDLDNTPRQSYLDYMQSVVARYRDSPAIAMWEPVGEPEASDCLPGYVGPQCYGHGTCPADAASVLRQFFDTVGERIHAIDPNHLVGDGVLGGTQCGWTGPGPALVDGSPGIDVLTYHDYTAETAPPVPPALNERLTLASELGKPLVIGEVGMDAGTAPGCASKAERAQEMTAKLSADVSVGLAGFMLWAYGGAPSQLPGCDYYLMDDDPTMTLLRGSAGDMWPGR